MIFKLPRICSAKTSIISGYKESLKSWAFEITPSFVERCKSYINKWKWIYIKQLEMK